MMGNKVTWKTLTDDQKQGLINVASRIGIEIEIAYQLEVLGLIITDNDISNLTSMGRIVVHNHIPVRQIVDDVLQPLSELASLREQVATLTADKKELVAALKPFVLTFQEFERQAAKVDPLDDDMWFGDWFVKNYDNEQFYNHSSFADQIYKRYTK